MNKGNFTRKWFTEHKHRFIQVSKPKNETKPVETKKGSKYDGKKNDAQKRAFKEFWLETLKNSWSKIRKQTGVKTGIVAALSHLFETELKAIEMKELNGLDFITYEYRKNKLDEFVNDMRKVLRKNPKLAKRVIDIYRNEFATMVKTAVENQYIGIDADYCGDFKTFMGEIELMLKKKIVPVFGNICLTFRKTSRSEKGVNGVEEMKKMLTKYPSWKLVKIFGGTEFFEYNDNENGTGHYMVGCILERIK